MATQLNDIVSIGKIITEMTLEEKLLLLTGDSFFHTAALKKYGIPSAFLIDGGTGFNTNQMKLETALQAGRKVNGKTDPEAADNLMGSENDSSHRILNASKNLEEILPGEIKVVEAFLQMSRDNLPDLDQIGCFPPGMLLGATWNPEAVYSCGEAAGREACAFGVDILLGTPNVNLHRDPRGGRLFEGYSEDPCLISKLAPQFAKGVQKSGVAANVKHFAANNQETERMGINEIIPERALRELYFPGFRACIQEGDCKTVMSAYNKINGIPCAENTWLLNQVLRNEWGFKGLVMSDWGAVYDRVESLKNGNDLTMPGPRKIGMLIDAVQKGEISIEIVNESVRRFLELLLELPVMKGRKYTKIDTVYSYAAAYKAAAEGITLLRNNGILPLKKNIHVSYFGDRSRKLTASGGGSANVLTNRVTNLYDSTVEKLGSSNVLYGKITDQTDVIIVTVGGNGQEAVDRPDMRMEHLDEILLHEVLGLAKKTDLPLVLVLNTSAPIELSEIIGDTSAVLCLYLPGMAGGQAGADILFGDIEPSGRLPLSWPKYYRDCPTSINFPGENNEVMYGEGLFVGYRYYDIKSIKPLFPFGYGLSYTKFEITELHMPNIFNAENENELNIEVRVKNTGNRPGFEVVQLYINNKESVLQKPYKELKAFKKVFLLPDEEQTICLRLTGKDFESYDCKLNMWVIEPGDYNILIGSSSENILLGKKTYVRRLP